MYRVHRSSLELFSARNKVLKLLNKPSVSADDLNELRKEVSEWDLELATDLELSRPQLRSPLGPSDGCFGELRLFKVEITSMLEDRALFGNIMNYNSI